MKTKEEVIKFYNKHNNSHIGFAFNQRHFEIQDRLIHAGLEKNHKVLEIGSGAGGPSELILRHLSAEGSLCITDISPDRIELADKRLSRYSNVTSKVIDFTSEKLDDKFDVVVLPDVLEHIPMDLHESLFIHISDMLTENGFVFINIPNPNYLQWLVDNESDLLQIIDQPIHTHLLAANLIKSNLFISFIENYSVFIEGEDYQVVILKRKPDSSTFKGRKPKSMSFTKRVIRKLTSLINGR